MVRKRLAGLHERSSIGEPAGAAAGAPGTQLVLRRCCVCDWREQLVETPGADPDCPWCHAPTTAEPMTAPPIADAGTEAGKNPHAAALGRLGGIKGGRARAERLSAKRRREIALKAARIRWQKT